MLSYRAYFALVGLFAVWVGAWGYLWPGEVERALPWKVPPLHARFIASMYLAGFVAMTASLLCRGLAAVRIAIALAAIWTGALFVVSLLHVSEFDFSRRQAWFWWGAYAVYPLWGAWLYFRGAQATARQRARPDPLLLAVGLGCLGLAAALFAAPQTMAGAWPWKVSPLLTHVYSGPFLAWGVAALLLAREASRDGRRIVLVAMLAFAVLALVASWLHARLFDFSAPAASLWFVAFAAWAAIAAWRLLRPLSEETARP